MTYETYRIVATFKHGSVWNKKVYLFLSIVFYPIALLLIPLFIWIALTNDMLISGKVFIFIFGPVIAVCFALVPFFVGRNRRWAKKCLKDVVERKVTARLFDEDISIGKSYKEPNCLSPFAMNRGK